MYKTLEAFFAVCGAVGAVVMVGCAAQESTYEGEGSILMFLSLLLVYIRSGGWMVFVAFGLAALCSVASSNQRLVRNTENWRGEPLR